MDTEQPKTQADAPPADTEKPAETPAETAAEAPEGGPSGGLPDLRRRFSGFGNQQPLSDDHVRAIMGDCANFLWQLMNITSGVLQTLDIGCVRNVIAADVPLPKNTVDENGKVLEQARPARDDHRKEPRGRKHPLTVWLGLALQGVRMLLRMTEGTNPEAHNRETLVSRINREEMRAQEREFARLFKGD